MRMTTLPRSTAGPAQPSTRLRSSAGLPLEGPGGDDRSPATAHAAMHSDVAQWNGNPRYDSRIASHQVPDREDPTDPQHPSGASSLNPDEDARQEQQGRITAFTIGGPASAFGTTPVMASPIDAKHAAPTNSVTRNSTRSAPLGTRASYATTPKTHRDRDQQKPDERGMDHPGTSGRTPPSSAFP